MIPDLTVVIRDGSDGLSDITIDGTTGYYVLLNGLGLPGEEVWSLEYAESRFVHGSALVSAKLVQTSGLLVVQVEGSTLAQVFSRIGALRGAVRQFSYYIDVTLTRNASSYTETFECNPANSTIGAGGLVQPMELAANTPGEVLTLTIPYSPVSGA